MTETMAMLLLYLAAALMYGTDSHRNGARLRALATRTRVHIAQGVALAAVGLAGWLWQRMEPGPAAFLVVPVGLMVAATSVALLAPVWPRLVWSIAVASVPAIVLLALGGTP